MPQNSSLTPSSSLFQASRLSEPSRCIPKKGNTSCWDACSEQQAMDLGVQDFLGQWRCLDKNHVKKMVIWRVRCYIHLLGQWLNFKLFGITYLVGKIKFKLFFFRVHWLSESIANHEQFFFLGGSYPPGNETITYGCFQK